MGVGEDVTSSPPAGATAQNLKLEPAGEADGLLVQVHTAHVGAMFAPTLVSVPLDAAPASSAQSFPARGPAFGAAYPQPQPHAHSEPLASGFAGSLAQPGLQHLTAAMPGYAAGLQLPGLVPTAHHQPQPAQPHGSAAVAAADSLGSPASGGAPHARLSHLQQPVSERCAAAQAGSGAGHLNGVPVSRPPGATL